ncbi:hypothetical protein Golob_026333 [Gossypium lobatum]|uniref:Uncharacterized protein n=1 Tax=Gossypium lobatum TaxID=34289 RepID=A0A7J8LUR5_9ROSI|nr:hypothetical protein [Gossypium lobatum]
MHILESGRLTLFLVSFLQILRVKFFKSLWQGKLTRIIDRALGWWLGTHWVRF